VTTKAGLKLDHFVIHVSEWQRSNEFYARVFGMEVIKRGKGYAYRLGDVQLNCHGPGFETYTVARLPVQPGNSDICFVWPGPIDGALAHLKEQGVTAEVGPVTRYGAQGQGTSIYFRDPDGSLLEFISYADASR
jgi:catechol 2,3-dioxygenase-like lactoylglutathione lyase family enzyme